jgi:hypothetical protein
MSVQPETLTPVDRVGPAVAALRAGRPVLVADDAGRENEYDVILPAALAEPRWTAWAVRHTSGLLCAPLPAERADALALDPMVRDNQDRAAPPTPSRSTPRTASPPGSARRTGPAPPGSSPTPPAGPPTSSAPGTCSRCGPAPVGSSPGPGTPRPGWTCAGSPGCPRSP